MHKVTVLSFFFPIFNIFFSKGKGFDSLFTDVVVCSLFQTSYIYSTSDNIVCGCYG